MSNYFGTDGIRGKVGIKPITADFFLKLGWAVGSVLAQKNENPSVVIGKDTRISGYLFESALEAGFLSAGVDVGLLGPMPTPAIAYLTQTYGATAGVVISASHNHFQDNGVKFFSNKGFKLSDQDQKAIEKRLSEPMVSVTSENIGKAIRHEQSLGRYIDFCKHTFDKDIDLSSLNIVIDCANGATYHIAENVFAELGANIVVINHQPDGFNINLDCGATDTQHLQKTVLENKADLGIAFDGDGDRLMMVDSSGELVDGDELVFIIAKAWQAQNRLKNNTVVGTQMTNLGVRHGYKDLGIDFIETDVGDRFVMEQMQKNNAVLGGEGSGHIICLEQTTSGDGIIVALQVLEVLVKSGKTLNALKSEVQKYPQVLINVKTKEKINLLQHQALQKAQLKVEKSLGEAGRVLIRASGTEPLIRIMVEGRDLDLVQESAEVLATTLS
ncbi:Phosphoglucosamine mutase (EC 5.4.2.10) [uncultured Gammaproteobacteria bacterium]|uniref:phosphoglucosamine mutase n=1 Tax=thiotrophic endosymbiont of Bathymodiolus puteoserpentis (Logatchev) TaxID=343240 RepID=UPI0010B65E3E|nr:phosphoglucosamine mutase [thiotrophic endosymbiont of Bathymodiolus puteoserpentis (Logatchev)]CAC9574914.1 Phosphoglucosamine mutase (EC 5.4.2.10) [uncultured Gammaproteobacteria bacterium]CAC9578948.1 Phosphoglucosamine mutase (EC 5.4.2.10) [uncultured Gammaproteobacteria bacterium]CAC9583564.1 Phosphoglucosamine mutase (EC 5.4.2.10) [uncultured Gammaproteobacteria bacterium]CAC9631473.1 Phosphoglucosamine mutase (EC 5.4.2.10) [uncultured Gammaproteobacteria bacterium]CAC9632866.1 Phosph